MFKKKFLLAAILTAPLFTMTSCNQGTIRVTLDTGLGLFLNGESYRTITIANGSSLSTALGEDIPMTDGVIESEGKVMMYPMYWVQGTRTIVHWNDGINASMILHARYFSSVKDAQYTALGKIGETYMDACAKQPDKIKEISVAYDAAVKHVTNAVTEGSAIGMGKIGSGEMDACARQPEAIDKIITVAEQCFVTLEAPEKTLSNNLATGVGKFGEAAMDACARQPEAIDIKGYKGLRDATSFLTDAIKNLPSYSGIGFGSFGSSFMDASARQPEAIGAILDNAPIVLNGFMKTKNSMQSYAIGKASSSWADSCARQPSHIKELSTELAKNIDSILNS